MNDDVGIEEVATSKRMYVALIRCGVRTVGQLRLINAERLVDLKGCGRKTIKEIGELMHECGLADAGELSAKCQNIKNARAWRKTCAEMDRIYGEKP